MPVGPREDSAPQCNGLNISPRGVSHLSASKLSPVQQRGTVPIQTTQTYLSDCQSFLISNCDVGFNARSMVVIVLRLLRAIVNEVSCTQDCLSLVPDTG